MEYKNKKPKKNINNEDNLLISEKKLEILLKNSPIGFQSLDINGNFLDVNKTWLEMFGYKKEEVIGKSFKDFLVGENKTNFSKQFELFKQKGETESELEVLHNDGNVSYVSFRGVFVKHDHEDMKTFCVLRNITENKKLEQKLKFSESHLNLAQSIAKIGSWELELDKNIVFGSNEAYNIYEIPQSLGYLPLSEIQKIVVDEDRPRLDEALKNLIEKGDEYNLTFTIKTRQGNTKVIRSQAILHRDEFNKPGKIIGIIHDVTEEVKKEEELKYLSTHDSLTDLYDRRTFFQRFREYDYEKYYPLGLMIMDVNGLKIFNDAFGHLVGDQVLKKISETLKAVFKGNPNVFRIGGDEFTVLFQNTTDNKINDFKQRIKDSLSDVQINNIELSLSIGYELKNDKIQTIDEIQKLAENRMYRNKTIVGSSMRSKAINAILETLTNKFQAERVHSEKVSEYCKQIGLALKLSSDNIEELTKAGLFHDIGKISIADNIISKPGKLTWEEFEIIKAHSEVGYQILRAADEFTELAIHALHHHERWDGLGYPTGLAGKNIPLFSRIIAVADAYEAMTADRPYRKALCKEEAVSQIVKYAGTQFDPSIAKVFVEKVLKAEFNSSN